MNRRNWIAVLCMVGMIGALSCSSDDVIDAVVPVEDQAEALIEAVFDEYVDPLSSLVDALLALVDPPPPSPTAGLELECPTTTGVCGSGSVSCQGDVDSLLFTFSNCTVVLAQTLIDGTVRIFPQGAGSYRLLLTNLEIDGADPAGGELLIDETACTVDWDLVGGDVILDAALNGCGENPDGTSSATVTVSAQTGIFVFVFTFDGTSTALVDVARDGSPVATCQMNLDTSEASCSAI